MLTSYLYLVDAIEKKISQKRTIVVDGNSPKSKENDAKKKQHTEHQ